MVVISLACRGQAIIAWATIMSSASCHEVDGIFAKFLAVWNSHKSGPTPYPRWPASSEWGDDPSWYRIAALVDVVIEPALRGKMT
jgi:hypothetical protein